MQAIDKVQRSFFFKAIDFIVYVLNALLLILMLSFFLTLNVSPANQLFFAYIGLATPIILVSLLLCILYWIITKRWKQSIMNIIGLIVCIHPILTYSPFNILKHDQPKESFKLLSYNVRGFNWRDDKQWQSNPIVAYMKSTNADIICIQEYMASTNENFATSKKLQQVLGADYLYYNVTTLRSTAGGHEYGLACFSKYPILEVTQIPIQTKDNGSVLYKININGKITTIINNHLESNKLTLLDKKLYKNFFKEKNPKAFTTIDDKLGRAYKLRATQADLIQQYVQNSNTDGIIVCGDFNDTPISYVYHKLTSNLSDSYLSSGLGPDITYHENFFWFRIDYILHSNNISSYKFQIDKVKYSDHYPITTYLNYNK